VHILLQSVCRNELSAHHMSVKLLLPSGAAYAVRVGVQSAKAHALLHMVASKRVLFLSSRQGASHTCCFFMLGTAWGLGAPMSAWSTDGFSVRPQTHTHMYVKQSELQNCRLSGSSGSMDPTGASQGSTAVSQSMSITAGRSG